MAAHASDMVLRWSATNGPRYTLQYAPNLLGTPAWSNVPPAQRVGPAAPPRGNVGHELQCAGGGRRAFFRVLMGPVGSALRLPPSRERRMVHENAVAENEECAAPVGAPGLHWAPGLEGGGESRDGFDGVAIDDQVGSPVIGGQVRLVLQVANELAGSGHCSQTAKETCRDAMRLRSLRPPGPKLAIGRPRTRPVDLGGLGWTGGFEIMELLGGDRVETGCPDARRRRRLDHVLDGACARQGCRCSRAARRAARG